MTENETKISSEVEANKHSADRWAEKAVRDLAVFGLGVEATGVALSFSPDDRVQVAGKVVSGVGVALMLPYLKLDKSAEILENVHEKVSGVIDKVKQKNHEE